MKIIPIAFAFDNQLLFPAKICLSSLLMTANEDTFYDIFILHGDDITIDDTDFIKLKHYGNCNIRFRPVPARLFKDCYEIRGITVATYYRLVIPQVVPEYDKIIYSDVDVIFREDQSKYYEMATMENCYMAGVNVLSFIDEPTPNYYQQKEQDAFHQIYAGNMILNSKKIIEDNIIEQFMVHIKKQYEYQDMDVINTVCKGNFQYLPPSFCFTPRVERFMMTKRKEIGDFYSEEDIEQAFNKGTVHYAGPKPWVTPFCFDADVWWEAYRKSIFFDKNYMYSKNELVMNYLDSLPFLKRIKLLLRFFKTNRK